MKERIELHCESSYSYKRGQSIITPKSLIEKCKKENISTISIVDYCSCSSIPVFERLKREEQLPNLKIIYGISLNILFDDIYVETVLLAKNQEGIKNLYNIVTLLNEDGSYFITKKVLDEHKNGLILGMSRFDFEKDYQTILPYYSYIEVSPKEKKEEVLRLVNYCKKNHLPLIATNKPLKLEKESIINEIVYEIEKENLDSTYALIKDDFTYYSKDEMLQAFSYLEEKEEIVLDSPWNIANEIEDYQFDFEKRYMISIEEKGTLRKECYERASMIYLDEIPKNVEKRLEEELTLIEEYNLEGTIFLLENLIHRAKKSGCFAMVGSSFSHSLVAYLLGLIPINPMDLKKQGSFLNEFKANGFRFEVFLPEEKEEELIEYLRKLLGTKYLYNKGSFSGITLMEESKYINPTNSNSKESLEKEFNEIKRRIGFLPDTYYLVPKEIEMETITPTVYQTARPSQKICSFEKELQHQFVTLRFRAIYPFSRLYQLEKKTSLFIEEIPLNDIKIEKNLYQKVKSNKISDYKSSIHYYLANHFSPTMKLCFSKTEQVPKNLFDLLTLRIEDKDFLPKVLYYYYDTYYRIYYPKDYYEVYLNQLIEHFSEYRVCTKEFIDALKQNPQRIKKTAQEDAGYELIISTMIDMLKLGLEDSINQLPEKITTKESDIDTFLSSILEHPITVIASKSYVRISILLHLIELLTIRNQYSIHIHSIRGKEDYYHQKLICFLSRIPCDILRKYYYPYAEISKNNKTKINKTQWINAIEQLQNLPLIITSEKTDPTKDYLDYLFEKTKEDVLVIDDFSLLLQKTNHSKNQVFQRIKEFCETEKKHVIFLISSSNEKEVLEEFSKQEITKMMVVAKNKGKEIKQNKIQIKTKNSQKECLFTTDSYYHMI